MQAQAFTKTKSRVENTIQSSACHNLMSHIILLLTYFIFVVTEDEYKWLMAMFNVNIMKDKMEQNLLRSVVVFGRR